jgi:hypothetical protein
MSNKNARKKGSLVTSGFYTFNLKKNEEIDDAQINVDDKFLIIMVNRSLPFPVMVVEEIKEKANKETAELDIQAKCRWFSLKSMRFQERWFDINLLSNMDTDNIKKQISLKISEDSKLILERKIDVLAIDFSIIYQPVLYEKVRLKTYILEKCRYAKGDHVNRHYHYKPPVLVIVEIENPKNKDLVRCLWYNPADDKYDDNLWLHPSILIKHI